MEVIGTFLLGCLIVGGIIFILAPIFGYDSDMSQVEDSFWLNLYWYLYPKYVQAGLGFIFLLCIAVLICWFIYGVGSILIEALA